MTEERIAEIVEHNGVKPLAMTSEGITIQSEKVFEKLARKPISASLITGLEGCHARWAFQSFLESDLFPVSGDTPALKGQLFHSTMEELFKLPAEERDREKIEYIVENLLNSKEHDYFIYKDNVEALTWLKESIDNYYKMGGQPKKIRIAGIRSSKTGEEEPGLEVAVDGKLFPEQERRNFGFIDRVVIDPKDESSIIVEDWKSGKAKSWKGKVGAEGWAEQRQQLLYSMLLEQKGYKVSQARLIYPHAKHIEFVDTTKKESREAVIKDVKEADEKLKVLTETNTFGFKPTFCNWCPLAKICPGAYRIGPNSEKCNTAWESQPESSELQKGLEIL